MRTDDEFAAWIADGVLRSSGEDVRAEVLNELVKRTYIFGAICPAEGCVAPMLHRLFIVMPRRDIIEVEALEKYYAEKRQLPPVHIAEHRSDARSK
jgi:hypothetical protein